MKHITFDLETLGNKTTAPIVQIAAVKFTDTNEILDDFNRHINLKSLSRYNFEVNYETIGWWFSQSDKAIKSVFCEKDTVDLRQALREFIVWIEKPSEYVYWSHATFDPPILDYNLKQVDLTNPIPYVAHRDIRTLTHFSGIKAIARTGIHHNALDDCIYQAAYISQGINFLNEKINAKDSKSSNRKRK